VAAVPRPLIDGPGPSGGIGWSDSLQWVERFAPVGGAIRSRQPFADACFLASNSVARSHYGVQRGERLDRGRIGTVFAWVLLWWLKRFDFAYRWGGGPTHPLFNSCTSIGPGPRKGCS
jgi:hypothetical protein